MTHAVTEAQVIVRTVGVLVRLKNHELTLNLEKYQILTQKATFLAFWVEKAKLSNSDHSEECEVIHQPNRSLSSFFERLCNDCATHSAQHSLIQYYFVLFV